MKSRDIRQSRTLLVTVLLVLAVAFVSCVEPSPLYGNWADNMGNSVSFFDDNTFNAKIKGSTGTYIIYEGNYSVLLNSLTMDCSRIGLRIVTEWDIRGNILYIDWVTADSEKLLLKLFKTSN